MKHYYFALYFIRSRLRNRFLCIYQQCNTLLTIFELWTLCGLRGEWI